MTPERAPPRDASWRGPGPSGAAETNESDIGASTLDEARTHANAELMKAVEAGAARDEQILEAVEAGAQRDAGLRQQIRGLGDALRRKTKKESARQYKDAQLERYEARARGVGGPGRRRARSAVAAAGVLRWWRSRRGVGRASDGSESLRGRVLRPGGLKKMRFFSAFFRASAASASQRARG